MNDSLIRDKGKDTKPWVGGGGLLNTPKRESYIDIPMLDFRLRGGEDEEELTP